MAEQSTAFGNSSEKSLSDASSVGGSGTKGLEETTSDGSCTIQSSRQDTRTCGAVARQTSDLSYDISSVSDADSEGDFRNSNENNGIKSRGKLPDACLSFDEECRELLDALNLNKSSVNADKGKYDDSSSDSDDEKGDSSDVSSLAPPLIDEQPTLETVAKLIKDGLCRKVVVLSGAGVSCAAGIPDFRTPGSGLYDNLEKFGLPYPEAVFDLSFYSVNPHPFVSLAAEIWPGIKHSPTITHSFVALLESKNLLVRNYTQNIDGLEAIAGVSEDKLVECHGHFRTASCIACGIPYDGKECKVKMIEEQTAPICPKCGGLIKPDIVFFGESLPVRFGKLLHGDISHADLLVVMGTSLKVAPVSLIPEMVSTRCPRVLINRELVGDFVPPGVDGNSRDVFEEGDCDDGILKLCRLLGWEEELMKINASAKLHIN